MKQIISKAMNSGMDFTRRGALKSFLTRFEIDPDVYDQAYISIKNMAFKKDFSALPFDNRVVILPHCLRDRDECKAEFTDRGYICARCGACDIQAIAEYAEDLGYKGVYIVPGGSMAKKIMEDLKPRGVVGVACFLELAESMELAMLYDIHPQGIPLIRDGCKDTLVDIEEVKDILSQKL